RADNSDGLAAITLHALLEAPGHSLKRLFPGCGNQAAIFANQRLGEPVFVVSEIEGVAALDAEKISIDAALVAVVTADDLHSSSGAPDAKRGLAAIGAVRTGGGDVVHLPGTGLVTVSTGSERAYRTYVDAHAALFALQMIFAIGRDHGMHAAV